MSIIIDSREKKIPEIKNILAEMDRILPDIQFKGLPLADYLLENSGNSILIERKAIGDFCANYVVLKDRMDKMRKTEYNYTALLIEGNYQVINGQICLWRGNRLTPSIPEKTFHKFVASQQARNSLYFHTQDLEETIDLMLNLHDYLPTMGINPVRKSTSGKELILSILGMGPLKLLELTGKYESALDALKHIEEWIPARARKLLEKW